MANGWQQTIKDWTIRRKILTGFAVVLTFTAALGWQAIRALERLNGAGSDAAGRGADLPGLPDDDHGLHGGDHRRRGAPRPRPRAADRGSPHPARDPGGAGLQGRPHHRHPEQVPGRDRVAGALDAADGEESPGDRHPDRGLLPRRRTVGRGDLHLLVPDGQGRRDAVQLHRGDLVHHGRDRLPDAEPGPERRGAGRERGPDLRLDPGDERDPHPDGRQRRPCSSARSRRPPALSAP